MRSAGGGVTEIIEGQVRALDAEVSVPEQRALVPAQPGQSIVSTGRAGPHEMLAQASEIATALSRMVEQQHLYSEIEVYDKKLGRKVTRKYLQVEAWMTIGRMDNVVARESHPPVRNDDDSYEAEVELVRLSDGMVIGRASALCGAKGDAPWDTRPIHQRRSMAVTRATSRAFRQQYAWIVTLAGYEPTPADEMPRDEEPTPEPVPTHAEGLIGTVEKGKPPVDLEMRQTPTGPAWGFKLKNGRKSYQVLATGPLAQALSVVVAEPSEIEGQRVEVWGSIDMIPWDKAGKPMPPYPRINLVRVKTPEWELPVSPLRSEDEPDPPVVAEGQEPLFDLVESARLDAEEAALAAADGPRGGVDHDLSDT
jgi:hypothetical protein